MPLMNEDSILTQAGSELQSSVWSREIGAQKLAVGGQQSAVSRQKAESRRQKAECGMLNAEGNSLRSVAGAERDGLVVGGESRSMFQRAGDGRAPPAGIEQPTRSLIRDSGASSGYWF